MLKINKVSLVDNQFTDEELQTGGICKLNAGTAPIGNGVWHFVKDGTATCVAAEAKSGGDKTKPASCKVEELVLKLTKKVRREIPVAKDQTEVDTGLKGLISAKKDDAHSTIATLATASVKEAYAGAVTENSGLLTLSSVTDAGILVVDLEVEVGEGHASHPSVDSEHKLEFDFTEKEPLHVVLYANAKNLEGAKLNVTDFHTRDSRIGIIKA